MAHNLLFTMGYNAPEDRLLPEGYDWGDSRAARRRLSPGGARRCGHGRSTSTSPRTTAPSRARVRTTRRAATACPTIPSGKLDIVPSRGYWLRDDAGHPTRAVQHICWDGCMFSNDMMIAAADVERRAEADDRRARRPWVGRASGRGRVGNAMKKKLNIGLVGYGFMGRTHSNAFLQAPRYLRSAVRARAEGGRPRATGTRRGVRGELGIPVGRDRLARAGRAQGHRPDRHRQPERYARRDRDCRRARRQDGDVREAARRERRRRRKRWSAPSRAPACRTRSGTTIAAFRPSSSCDS